MGTLFVILKVLSASGTFAGMFGAGLRLGFGSLRAAGQRPALFARALLAVWIAVPVLTVLVITALGVDGLSATILLLMAVCPGVPLVLSSARKVRGAQVTAFVALLLTAATEPLLIPYGTRLVSTFLVADLSIQPMHVLQVLVPTVFLPVVLAFVIRARVPRVADALEPLCTAVYAIGVAGSVIVVATQALPLLPRLPPRAFLAAIIITLGDAVIGYWAGRPRLEDQKAVALATALGNPALALAVVEVSYPGYRAVYLVAVYLTVRAIALYPFEWWAKRLRDRPVHHHHHHHPRRRPF